MIVAFAATLFISCGQKSENPRELTEDEARIEAVLKRAEFEDADGNKVYLSDFEGKVVIVDFWETWCGPCLQVFPAMDSLRTNYPDDFEVLAVNLQESDDPQTVMDFAEAQGYDFNFLLDVNQVGADVITLGIPFKVFFDPNGHLISAELGAASAAMEYEKTKVIIEENKQTTP
jgi:thiol-disulfide isomerase/thioredoxin